MKMRWFLLVSGLSMAVGFSGGSATRADDLFAWNYGSIQEFGSSGTGTVFASLGLNVPLGLAFDTSGDLFVANHGNNTIEKFNSSGMGMVFANSGMDAPWGLAFDSKGNLYVGSYYGNDIEEFDPSGNGTVFANSVFGPSFISIWPDMIPEPSSLLLTMVGLVSLWAVARRRRR